ncbi:hypothetical protein [Colwellia sp. MEBiC06753]
MQIEPINHLKDDKYYWLLGLTFIGVALSVYGISAFPAYTMLTLTLMALVTGLFLYRPALIFALLPSIFIIADFSSISGRFIVNELDYILLPAVLGSLALIKKEKIKLIYALPLIVFVLIAVYSAWQFPISNLFSPSFTNPYFDDGYRFRVAKGFLYGIVLAVCFSSCYQKSPSRLLDALIWGGVTAAFFLFLLVCWERGVLTQLAHFSNWWQPVSTLLDFSSSYRVTAITSAMHTGGEAYDGYLLFIAPVCLLGCLYWQNGLQRLIALLALFCLGYCVLVGFTRTTYAAIAISLIVLFIAMSHIRHQSEKPKLSRYLAFGLVNLLAFGAVFYLNGYMGVASCGLILMSVLAANIIQQQYQQKLIGKLMIAIAGVIAIYLLMTNNSKWVSSSIQTLSISVGILVVWAWFLQSQIKQLAVNTLVDALFSYVATLGAALILIAAGSGYQINARMETVVNDLQGRMAHWLNVVKSGNSDMATIAFGNGFGSFPLNYVLTHPEKVTGVGNFTIRDKTLVLNQGGDLGFGQRVHITPDTDYRLTITTDFNQQASLSVYLCEKNLIFASNFSANCAAKTIRLESIQTEYVVELNSGTIGRNGLLGWPATLYLKHSRGKAIDITALHLAADSQPLINLLDNSQFQQGMDHWFFFNDYQHLPWHIKNTYLGFYYQTGLVGIVLLAWILTALFVRSANTLAGRSISYLVRAYVVGVAIFGFFGDPFDSPRTSILFSILVFGGYLTLADSLTSRKRLKIQLVMLVGAMAIYVALLQIPKFASYSSNVSFQTFSVNSLGYEEQKPTHYTDAVMPPGDIRLDGQLMPSLSAAAKSAKDASVIELAKGHYNEAAIITKNKVRIIAEEGAVIFGKAINGKGALLITGDNVLVRGLECHSIEVADGNGVCVRFEGSGIILDNVYFHHAQGGFLGTPKGGLISIVNSRFEYLGNNGFYHGIYTLENTELYIKNSTFINTFNAGHEVKSRSSKTTIEHSIIANTTTQDSRLVDVPNGGELIIKNSVLIEGPFSDNFDLLSFGVEGRIYQDNSILIENNLIISDRNSANLIAVDDEVEQSSIQNNFVVGDIAGIDKQLNEWFATRSDFGLPKAPNIPTLNTN